jgi:hypothetical protein
MEHNHNKCEHKNLKYCPHCDLVYCEDCKKEWKNNQLTWTYGSGTTTLPCNNGTTCSLNITK